MSTVERINPNAFKYYEAVEIGHVIMRSFRDDDMFKHVVGDKYIEGMRFATKISGHKSPCLGLSGVSSPAERTSKAAYDILVKTWADCVYQNVYNPGFDVYRLVDEQGYTIGVAIWKYPDYMIPQLEYDLDRTGWLFWLKRLAVNFGMKLANLFRYAFDENPIFNSRLKKFGQTRKGVFYSKLSKREFADLPSAQFDHTIYPEQYMLYLMTFGVLPECRGKGHGKMLLQTCLDTIPNTKIYLNGKVYPQKIHLEATELGLPLYLRFGFDTKEQHLESMIDYHTSYMILRR